MPIAPGYLGFPDEDYMAADDGLPENLQYVDVRWLGTRERFDAMWAHEEDLLAFHDAPESDAAFEHFSDSESYAMGFDGFVGSTVIALAIIGAVPCSSCSGAPGHHESHPCVAFWCDAAQLVRVEQAAAAAGVHVAGVAGDPPSVMVWTPKDVQKLREFARGLVGA